MKKQLSLPLITLAMLVGLSATASAQPKAQYNSAVCSSAEDDVRHLRGNTELTCTSTALTRRGKMYTTINEIVEKGYRITSVTANHYIEGNYRRTTWAIVVEKEL